LTATSGAAALANVIANSNTLTISDTDATVAQIQTLNTAGATVTALNAVDTAANLTAMGSTLLASLNGATVSDNGSVTQNVAALTKIYSADGAQYANYSIVDTAANIATAIASDAGLVNFASAVTQLQMQRTLKLVLLHQRQHLVRQLPTLLLLLLLMPSAQAPH